MTNYANIRYQPAAATTTTVADMTALIAVTGMSNGDQALVLSSNNLFMYSGSGWYKIATIQNDSPTAITGVDGTYSLAIDGTPTVITAVSTDPEGFPLTWTYSTSGLGSIATVSQVDNVFTITPSTDEANVGTFSLTINATDGVNGAVSANTSITLQFQILNSKYTTLLATAVDTSDNNNITDSSSNNHTITVTGDAHAGTFSPYRHGRYSTYFDGTGDYLTISHASDFNFGSGDFTAEAWFNVPDTSGTDPFITTAAGQGVTGIDHQGFWLGLYQGQYFFIASSNGLNWDIAIQTGTPQANTWTHICVVRSGNTFTLYVNGVSIGTATNSGTLTNSNNLIAVGGRTREAQYSIGYLRDVRVIKGSAVIPDVGGPISPLTAVTNTTLLTCHLPYIADGSSNAHSITVNGNTSTKPFTPYDNLEYAAADHGGSVYFDGTGDVIYTPQDTAFNFGTGDFTFEAWVYPTLYTSNNWNTLFAIGNSTNFGGLLVGKTDTGSFVIRQYGTANVVATTNLPDLNAWTHIACVRSSGTSKLYYNGSEIATASDTTNYSSTTPFAHIGNSDHTSYSHYWNGYVSDARFISGTAVYSGAFTPPSGPLTTTGGTYPSTTNVNTSITSGHTKLLIKGTDASIIDKSQGSNLKLFGNTTGSTTQVKFTGSKSMYFNGSTDYLLAPASSGFAFGTGDFTVELWAYPISPPTNYDAKFVGTHYYSPADGDRGWGFSYETDGTLIFYMVGTTGSGEVFNPSMSALTTNTWHHLAATRSGTDLRIFLNGTAILTGTSTYNEDLVETLKIGTGWATGLGSGAYSGYKYNGYMYDIRVTKGLARYTANFTPPTEPLKG